MKELLGKMVAGLLKKVEENVPETGNFEVVYEREDVSEMKIGLSHVILKVTTLRSDDENERFLELGAVDYPFPYGAETAIGYGRKQDILAKLQEPDIVETLHAKLKNLIDDIDYEERHPYG